MFINLHTTEMKPTIFFTLALIFSCCHERYKTIDEIMIQIWAEHSVTMASYHKDTTRTGFVPYDVIFMGNKINVTEEGLDTLKTLAHNIDIYIKDSSIRVISPFGIDSSGRQGGMDGYVLHREYEVHYNPYTHLYAACWFPFKDKDVWSEKFLLLGYNGDESGTHVSFCDPGKEFCSIHFVSCLPLIQKHWAIRKSYIDEDFKKREQKKVRDSLIKYQHSYN